jgi:hypothetical protein
LLRKSGVAAATDVAEARDAVKTFILGDLDAAGMTFSFGCFGASVK